MGTTSESSLHFSSTTITFDTLFTSIGSPTKNLRVTNRVYSIKCVKVRKVIINNFDHGKESDEEKRETITIE